MPELCLLAYGIVDFPSLLVLIRSGVVEMQSNSVVSYLYGFYAGVDKAFAEFAVLSAVLHALVEAVGSYNVAAPARRIHSVPACACRSDSIHESRKCSVAEQLRHLETELYSMTQQKRRRKSSAEGDVIVGNSTAEVHGKLEISARKKHPLRAKRRWTATKSFRGTQS